MAFLDSAWNFAFVDFNFFEKLFPKTAQVCPPEKYLKIFTSCQAGFLNLFGTDFTGLLQEMTWNLDSHPQCESESQIAGIVNSFLEFAI